MNQNEMNPFLSGVVVCTTGLSPESNQLVRQIARQSGARLMIDYRPEITHLLVGKVGSDKYIHGMQSQTQINILRPEWIYDSFEAKCQKNVDDYRALPFTGLTISITQILDATVRDEIQKTIENNGGTFSANLLKEECTHLIACKPEGEKYNAAVSWNMKICNASWIDDCVSRKTWIKEDEYFISVDNPTSSSTNDRKLSSKRKKNVNIKSNQIGKGKKKLQNDNGGKAQEGSQLQEKLEDEEEVSNIERKKKNIRKAKVDDTSRFTSLPNALQAPLSSSFKNDSFFLGGFKDSHRDHLKILIMKCSGKISQFLHPNQVTKILLGEQASEELKNSVRHVIKSGEVQLVGIEWVNTVVFGDNTSSFEETDMRKGKENAALSSNTTLIDSSRNKLKFKKRYKRNSVGASHHFDESQSNGMASRIRAAKAERTDNKGLESQYVVYGTLQSQDYP